jgi:hypothetical protein
MMRGPGETLDLGLASSEQQQSFLLGLLEACGGAIEGRRKFMKLVFLLEHYDPARETLEPVTRFGVFEDFFIYDHGPFSRDVVDTFDDLKRKDLIEESASNLSNSKRQKRIKLTAAGHEYETDVDAEQLARIVSGFDDRTAAELEDTTWSLLDIEHSETFEYRYTDVSDVLH